MSSPERQVGDSGSSGGRTLSRVLAVVGAGGALIGWVAVVGAIREYARFAAAGIPSPAETAGLFPREALIGEGLTALVPPLLIGLGLAGLTFLGCSALTTWVTRRLASEEEADEREHRNALWQLSEEDLNEALPASQRAENEEKRLVLPRQHEEWRRERQRARERYLTRAVLAIAVVFFLTGVLLLAIYYMFVWQELLVALALLAVLAAAVEFAGWLRSATVAAASVFAAIAIYGGVGEFWHQSDEPNPRFDSVVVYRGHLATVSGFFVTRSGGDIYVAVLPERSAGRNKFAILSIPDSQAELVVLGPEYRLTGGEVELQGGQSQPGVSRTPVPSLHGRPTPEPQVEPGPTVPKPTPPPPPSAAAAIRVFALDEVVPAQHDFCFPVGSGQSRETVALAYTAHVAGVNPSNVFLAPSAAIELGPESKRWVHVAMSPGASELLQRGRTLAVDVSIVATAPGGASKALTYRLDLLEPRGRPGQPPCGP